MKGKQAEERGCMVRGIEDLFSLIDLSREGRNTGGQEIGISMYHIYNEKIVDLLEPHTGNMKTLEIIQTQEEGMTAHTKIKGLSQHILKGAYDCQSYFQRASKVCKIESTEQQDPDIHLRAHTVVLITLFKQIKGVKKIHSQIQFVELASSEQAVEKNKYKVKSAITTNFNNLSVKLLKHAQRKINSSKDKLQQCLDITMDVGNKVLFACCVAPSLQKLMHSLPALKFAAKIKECIDGPHRTNDGNREELPEREENMHTLKRKISENNLILPEKDDVDNMEEICIATSRGNPKSEMKLENFSQRRASQESRNNNRDFNKTDYVQRNSGLNLEGETDYSNRKGSTQHDKMIGSKKNSVCFSQAAEVNVCKSNRYGESTQSDEESKTAIEVEPQDKMSLIEKKTKSIAKTLKKIESSEISKHYDNLLQETKAVYEHSVEDLRDRNKMLEQKLAEKEEEALCEKPLKSNEGTSSSRKMFDIDIDQYQKQLSKLKGKLKEKNETLAKLQNSHTLDIKEITELKY